MFKLMIPIAIVAVVAIAATAYAVSSSSSTDRTDCPGKIICPLTGELVCKDRCPLHDDAESAETVVLPAYCNINN